MYKRQGISITRDSQGETPWVESWSIVSPYQQGTNKIEVLLPSRLEPMRQYPVVYCLPVNPGTKGNWGHPLTEAIRCGLAEKYQAIFVTPSFSSMPWYGNNPENPLFRENDHITKAVIPFIESHYPVDKGGSRAHLIGFSKSALGALALFLNDPCLLYTSPSPRD